MMIRKKAARTRWFARSLAVFCGIAAACSAGASTNNLLFNGSFASGASGWETFTYGGGWASVEIPGKLAGTTPTTWPAGWPAGAGTNAAGTGPVYDGTLQLTCGGFANAGGFVWQTIAAAENVEYTLVIQGGAENWWLPTAEIRLIWLDAGNVEISRNVVRTTDSLHNDTNGGQGDRYDTGVPYQNWTNAAVAPPGTKSLKVELCNPVGTGSVWFDNAVLTAPIDPPVIANLYPDGTRLFSTNKLSFTATSAAPIQASGVTLTINGVDVSPALTITGAGTTSLGVSYTGLESNLTYTAVISVTDSVNLTSVKNVSFDTFAPVYVWESEDYDFNGGSFINNPVLSSAPAANSYFGVSGMAGVDFYDRNGNGDHAYRSTDTMATSLTGDIPRQPFVDAGVSDHNIGWFDGAGFPGGSNVGIGGYQPQEWVNYTRTFTPGSYNLYVRAASGNGPTATLSAVRVTGGHGTTEQVTSPLGVFRVPAQGWGTYSWVPLTDAFGNRVKVGLTNTETVKILAGSGANLNFFMLLPADVELPTITSVSPDGATVAQGTNQLTFTVASATHTIPQANVSVTLNGVDVSPSLAFSGSSSSWNVSAPLQLNITNYTAVIAVTDDAGNSHSTTLFFDTLNPSGYGIEAEDFDFDGGSFIDNPVITSAPSPDSYFDRTSVDAVDSFYGDQLTPTTADFRYRSADIIATSVCTDTPTRAHLAARATNDLAFNYNVGWWATNGWLNYTHNYPAGQYRVFARVAGGVDLPYTLRLDKVSGGTVTLGTFNGVGRGYNAFDWVPLVDGVGQPATISLDGLATLRTTTVTGNVNPNSYWLVPAAQAVPEPLQFSYAAGVLTLTWTNPSLHLQVQTNAPGAGISGAWVDLPQSSPATIPVGLSNGSVFFRLSN